MSLELILGITLAAFLAGALFALALGAAAKLGDRQEESIRQELDLPPRKENGGCHWEVPQ